MFRKPFKTHGSTLLKKSDHKKLRENLRTAFPSLSEEQLSLLVSSKDEVTSARVTDTHCMLYFVGGQPLFFEPTGRGDLYPTVYALWKVPSLMPSLMTHGPVFVKHICRGADLMLPGVVLPEGGIAALGEFGEGQRRALVIAHGPGTVAVGVGSMVLSAQQLRRQGMQGKAMKMMHFFHDKLWELGSREEPPAKGLDMSEAEGGAEEAEAAPNSDRGDDEAKAPHAGKAAVDAHASPAAATGRLGMAVDAKPDEGKKEELDNDEDEEEGEEDQDDGEEEKERSKPRAEAAAAKGSPVLARKKKTHVGGGGEGDEGAADEGAAEREDDEEPEQEGDAEPKKQKEKAVTTAATTKAAKAKGMAKAEGGQAAAKGLESMDALLLHAFLEAVTSRVKDKDLPMLVSSFYSAQVLACRPPNVDIDIKKSSYKKVSKFMDEMVAKGLIQVAEQSVGVFQLVGVNRAHELYGDWKHSAALSGNAQRNKEPSDEEASSPPLVEELFRPTKNLAPLFRHAVEAGTKKDEAEPEKEQERRRRKAEAEAELQERHYTKKEAQDVLWLYVRDKKLSEAGGGGGAAVTLDDVLAEGLYPGKDADFGAGDQVLKKELRERYLAKLAKFHRVRRGTFLEIRKGAVQPVHIVAEQRQGRKCVTRVTGLETFAVSPEEMAHELQKKLASAASTHELPAKGAGKELLVQGHFLRELEEYLSTQHGIPVKYIETLDKTQLKKKK